MALDSFEKNKSQYVIVGWPAQGAGTLSVASITDASGAGCFNVNLSYTGSFSVDQTIRINYDEFVASNGNPGTTNGILVFASDPAALVVGDVAGTPAEEGATATFPVRLRTRQT